ncbi:MAG: flagellar filament capping protein FliD [Chthonomonas sp.]|nr:flagellar filament capping protein FliD [Chthonomonas sp.]
MSIGSSSGISFSGLASGIDSSSIISQYMRIENLAVTRVQNRQNAIKQQLSAFGQFKSQLRGLSNSIGQLATAFNLVQGSATIADSDIAKIENSSNAAAGNFSLRVNKLAQSHKLTSDAKATDVALGYNGSFKINDKTVVVTASDTMANIATKIQSAGASASATVINNGTGSSYLSLTAGSSGVDNAMRLEDTQGDILEKLGILERTGGTTTTTTRISGESIVAVDKDASFAKLFGIPTDGDPASVPTFNANLVLKGIDPVKFRQQNDADSKQTLTINGQSVTYKMSDSLSTLSDAIYEATGIKPTIENTPGGAKLNLGVPNADITDTGGIFNAVQTTSETGVTKRIKSSAVVLAAQDAEALVDGILVKSASNKLEKAVNGLSITLLKADPAKETQVTISKSFEQTKGMVTSFVDNFNGMAEFISQATQFDKETYATAALFGNAVISQIEGEMNGLVTKVVPGLTGKYRSLVDLGITSDGGGKIKVDQSKLADALETNPDAVKKIFQATADVTGDGFSFVSSTDKSKVTGSAWNVNITQAAQKASRTVGNFDPTGAGATIRLNGGGLSSEVSLSVAAGTSKADMVRAINADTRLNALFEASVTANGELKIESKRFGASGNFTWTPSWTGTQSSVNGQDVMGTINGEPATGSGQFLTGNKDNLTTEGVQLMVTSTTTGALGTLQFQRGIGSLMQQSLEKFMDGTTGLLTSNEKGLQQQIDDFDKQIVTLQERAKAKEAVLKSKFDAMERAIAASQAQGSRLTSILGSGSSG